LNAKNNDKLKHKVPILKIVLLKISKFNQNALKYLTTIYT